MVEDYVKQIELFPKDGGEAVRLTIRALRSDDDYHACLALEKKVWGQDFAECVPPSMLMINQKVGGISAGAFDDAGNMLGMIYGLTGVRDDRVVHWSHMLGVDERARGLGLGREMKFYQREALLRIGTVYMEWTYDPLEYLNANLNINRLGALPVDYALDVYGSGDTSGLHAGIGTDRFIVRWMLETPNDPAPASARFTADVPFVNTADGEPLIGDFDLPEAPRLKVEIPASIQQAKKARSGLGREWRMCTRRAFTHYMNNGYRVTCMVHDASGRCFYGLEANS
ncbi:MAG: hypothetical protein QNK37_14465 [Acidobacteriota bacterium]|nr:hypothetical protein [Acidobacteriota bacterium]